MHRILLDQLHNNAPLNGNSYTAASGSPSSPLVDRIYQNQQLERAFSEHLLALIEKRNGALSPIHRLNDDVLRAIFRVPASVRKPILHRRCFALAVTAVGQQALEVGRAVHCVPTDMLPPTRADCVQAGFSNFAARIEDLKHSALPHMRGNINAIFEKCFSANARQPQTTRSVISSRGTPTPFSRLWLLSVQMSTR
ncbi:hypothetical protein CALCODRAFT_209735 [Calocera cornea HHB12733]|uniref:Uncharacterized protein n=1 Tax=Calocera cornea HHB12733 TaxID=1353952 RepID=A0A165HDU6_9BASI|nr:hypothetical protein CALCODRAFT_209735 [Calocera cornea HHB12733]